MQTVMHIILRLSNNNLNNRIRLCGGYTVERTMRAGKRLGLWVGSGQTREDYLQGTYNFERRALPSILPSIGVKAGD
jgi:hypothetical protein